MSLWVQVTKAGGSFSELDCVWVTVLLSMPCSRFQMAPRAPGLTPRRVSLLPKAQRLGIAKAGTLAAIKQNQDSVSLEV